jgi:hypothetical protein
MRIHFSRSFRQVTSLLLCLVCLLTTMNASASPGVSAATSGLQVSATPAVVPANGSLTLTVRNADGSAYSGLLDYDALICPTYSIKSADCRVSHADEPWSNTEVVSGTATVNIDNADGNGATLSEGMYIVRYRPHNSSGQYSNQIAFVVDRAARPVSEATMNNAGTYPVPKPVAGAYVVYRDVAADGSLNGYTKVEIEQSACGSGLMQRFTKTSAGAYWSPGDPQSTNIATLRWCIGPSETSPTNFRATDILGYSFSKSSTSATSLRNVRYDDASFGNLARLGTPPSTQAEADLEWLLNGGGPQGRLHLQQQLARRNALRPDASTDPAALYYTLAPTNLFPPTLTSTWTPIVDRIVAYDATNKVLDTWHVEVRASQLGGLYEIRYVEWALYIENLSAQSARPSTWSQSVSDWKLFYRWDVLEDWDWNADGTQNRITQQGSNRAFATPGPNDPPIELPIDCWRTPNACITPAKHTLNKIVRYQPDTSPLAISFVDNFGSDVPVLNGGANQPLQLHVRTADGQPYDGFLQLATSGGHAVWTDANNYPIYVHNGLVEVLPSAFGSAGSTVLAFQVRQQTLNASIAADNVLTNVSQPTNETQSFSNEIYFVQTFS